MAIISFFDKNLLFFNKVCKKSSFRNFGQIKILSNLTKKLEATANDPVKKFQKYNI